MVESIIVRRYLIMEMGTMFREMIFIDNNNYQIINLCFFFLQALSLHLSFLSFPAQFGLQHDVRTHIVTTLFIFSLFPLGREVVDKYMNELWCGVE